MPLDGDDGVHHQREGHQVELPDGDDTEGEQERERSGRDLGRRECGRVAFGHTNHVAVQLVAQVGAVRDEVAAPVLHDARAAVAGVLSFAAGRQL